MSRGLNRLTVRQVSTLGETGRHADGGGLYLRITGAGSRSWVFISVTDGRRARRCSGCREGGALMLRTSAFTRFTSEVYLTEKQLAKRHSLSVETVQM
jgi:hypothetical protein